MSEIAIQQITCAPDAEITKTDTHHFALPIFYHLADGRVVPGHYTARRKRDVQAYRQQLPLSPTGLFAKFRDDQFVGTVKVMSLFP